MKIARPTLLLFALASSCVLFGSANYFRYHQKVSQAYEAFLNRDYSQALQIVRSLEGRYELFPNEHYLIAKCQLALGHDDSASAALQATAHSGGTEFWMRKDSSWFIEHAGRQWFIDAHKGFIAILYADWDLQKPSEYLWCGADLLQQQYQEFFNGDPSGDGTNAWMVADNDSALVLNASDQLGVSIIQSHGQWLESILKFPQYLNARSLGNNSRLETVVIHSPKSSLQRVRRQLKHLVRTGQAHPIIYAEAIDHLDNERGSTAMLELNCKPEAMPDEQDILMWYNKHGLGSREILRCRMGYY